MPLGGIAGATALTASWSTTATIAELLGADHPYNVTYTLLNWLLGLGLDIDGMSLLLYVALLSLFIGIGSAYHELILPYLAPRGASLPRQAFGLALLALGLFGIVFASTLLAVGSNPLSLWWWNGGPIVLLGVVLGALVYAPTTVYSRALAIAAIPTLRRPAS